MNVIDVMSQVLLAAANMEPRTVLELIVPHLSLIDRSQVALTCKQLSVIFRTDLFKLLKKAHKMSTMVPFISRGAIRVKMYALVSTHTPRYRNITIDLMEEAVASYEPPAPIPGSSNNVVSNSLRSVTAALGECARSKSIYDNWSDMFPSKYGHLGTWRILTYEEACAKEEVPRRVVRLNNPMTRRHTRALHRT